MQREMRLNAAECYQLSPGGRPRRWKIEEPTLAVLEEVFALEHFPSSQMRSIIASELRVTTRQVQVWFQNRRQRERSIRRAKGLSCDLGPSRCDRPTRAAELRACISSVLANSTTASSPGAGGDPTLRDTGHDLADLFDASAADELDSVYSASGTPTPTPSASPSPRVREMPEVSFAAGAGGAACAPQYMEMGSVELPFPFTPQPCPTAGAGAEAEPEAHFAREADSEYMRFLQQRFGHVPQQHLQDDRRPAYVDRATSSCAGVGVGMGVGGGFSPPTSGARQPPSEPHPSPQQQRGLAHTVQQGVRQTSQHDGQLAFLPSLPSLPPSLCCGGAFDAFTTSAAPATAAVSTPPAPTSAFALLSQLRQPKREASAPAVAPGAAHAAPAASDKRKSVPSTTSPQRQPQRQQRQPQSLHQPQPHPQPQPQPHAPSEMLAPEQAGSYGQLLGMGLGQEAAEAQPSIFSPPVLSSLKPVMQQCVEAVHRHGLPMPPRQLLQAALSQQVVSSLVEDLMEDGYLDLDMAETLMQEEPDLGGGMPQQGGFPVSHPVALAS